jgi:hypothetical protein
VNQVSSLQRPRLPAPSLHRLNNRTTYLLWSFKEIKFRAYFYSIPIIMQKRVDEGGGRVIRSQEIGLRQSDHTIVFRAD